MLKIKWLLPLFLSVVCQTSVAASRDAVFADRKEVRQFIQEMHRKHQLDPKTLLSYFKAYGPNAKILTLMSRQFEALPWYHYKTSMITDARIQQGVLFWKKNAACLQKAERQFGVPSEIIVAILGIETSYGQKTGTYPLVQSLATLAFDYPRRAHFFRAELEQLLLLGKEGALDLNRATGSYAGATGIPQFMPSSYHKYAIDFSGTGKRDLLRDTEDAIGSVANYLKKHHWKKGEKIAYQTKTLRKNSRPKTKSFVLDHSKETKEYWVGLHNFSVIMRYNHSVHYAMAVYQLSQRILHSRQG